MRKVSLGRMAIFLIPTAKLGLIVPGHQKTVEDRIEEFLFAEYQGFTASTKNSTGWWKDASGGRHYDEHKEYKVSFPGKERIAKLDEFLAEIARDIEEECIYVETGEDAWLVYPE